MESVKQEVSQKELLESIGNISKCQLYIARDEVQRS